MERTFSPDEKRAHLEAFADACDRLAALFEPLRTLAVHAPSFRELARSARALAAGQFAQDALNRLATSVQPVFASHPRWEAPLVLHPDGSRSEPPWFPAVEQAEAELLRAADLLRAIGSR